MRILALNGGSSSLKASLFEVTNQTRLPELIWDQSVERRDASVIQSMLERHGKSIDAVGHRIVHGGDRFRESQRITAEVKAALAELSSLAPKHNRFELEAVDSIESILGAAVPQVAVFDTAFHATLPPAAYVYPGPYEWVEQGIRRFGFHGISHQYVARRSAELLGRESLKLITCHLGGGCSLAAISNGQSVDTTMGFTPLDGLMMGARSGSIDPGILIYLARRYGHSPDDLDRILNAESGLLGVSGISADMRAIVKAMLAGQARARLAFEVFVHRLCQGVAAMCASLGGIDALAFTGGIGENCAELRAAAAGKLAFLGVTIDPSKNQSPVPDGDISPADSTVRVLVIRTREEQEIAREVHRVLSSGKF